jgi:circadian clock protein KaiC
MPDATPASPRTTTGVPGLDRILSGGLIRGSTAIVHGPAGAGKTVLASQTAFHQAASGANVLYVTLLAESHTKLISHLRSLAFFDVRAVGHQLVYLSGYKPVRESTGALLTLLHRELMSKRPSLLVLDGIACIQDLHGIAAGREFLHDLQVAAETIQCTALLLTTNASPAPEDAVADALLSLAERQVRLRPLRELRVEKMRGSTHLSGGHTFIIDQNGFTVFPRVEALHRLPSPPVAGSGMRLGFDIPALESMLRGGLPSGSTTLVLGATGTGKTLLGLSFLAAGLARAESALYSGFYEPPARLIDNGEGIGLRLRDHVESGRLQIDWRPPVELLIDAWADRVLQLVRDTRPMRIFIDGLNAITEGAAYPERLSAFLTALSNELRALGVTTIIAGELHPIIGPTLDVPLSGVSPLVENTILLRYVETQSQFRRLIAVLKVRESGHDSGMRVFTITSTGVRVEPTSSTNEGSGER